MNNLEAISRIVGLAPSGPAVYGKQQLMLLRLNAVFLRGSFAEIEEPPDLPAERGQIAMRIAVPLRLRNTNTHPENGSAASFSWQSSARAWTQRGRRVRADGAIPAAAHSDPLEAQSGKS